MSVKQAGIALIDPTHTCGSNRTASYVITGYLVAALFQNAYFWSGDHAILMGEGRDEIRRRHAKAADMVLTETRAAASTEDAHQMGSITRTGAWMSALPSNVNGMDLGAQ